MKICNIFPVNNQSCYKGEEYVMTLAHLLAKHKYSIENFDISKQYIIIDNGLFEGEQVSTDILDLIHLVERNDFPVNEIVVPDVLDDCKGTIKLFEDNKRMIARYDYKYRFMIVAHSKDFEEFKSFFNYIKQFKDLKLTIGVPKRGHFDRMSDEAIELYKDCPFPIHFLGIKNSETYTSLYKVKDYVRSCDSALAAIITKYHEQMISELDSKDFMHYHRGDNEVIDLENDNVNEYKLQLILKEIKEIF